MMNDEDLFAFVRKGIFDEIIPTLDLPKSELTEFANDDAEVTEFMKTASPAEVLKRTDYWGEDLSFLLTSIERHIENIEANGVREALREC